MYRNNRFVYDEKGKEYCSRIVNVTFDFSVKEFNRTGKDIYIKIGHTLDEMSWKDGVSFDGEELIGIKTNLEITNPLSEEQLGKYFYFKDNKYWVKNNIKTIRTVAKIREELYDKGFTCDGIHYIRFKRSSGSARIGKCLFIDEKLYPQFHKWEMCGLTIRKNSKVDLAALESYISLTSSSIIDNLNIDPSSILVVDDYESTFTDDVINVFEENNEFKTKAEIIPITNSIFDGESLIDISIMGDYACKGMLLLRNRFFKSCCFNTNIQQWFVDNNITKLSQLNGYTRAKRVEDIKLITTPSSIKYLKFASLEQWFDNIESEFGIVKYEKPTHFMNGKLVQTHYQLINTIQFTKDELNEFLQPTFDLMTLLKNNPEVLRYWINFKIEDETTISAVKSKTDVIYKMMSINEDFYKTKLYYDFKLDFLKSFTKDLKCGHVLVNGNYSVLCGNPIELLQQSIGQFNGNTIMENNSVYSTRFDFDKTLLGSRSPHITISNIWLIQNKYNDLIDTYMNTTDGIVYVNSIGVNVLQQLAGCDYDSDSLLLTDNECLIKATQKNYGKFKVAVCNVQGVKKQRKYNHNDMADLDIKTSTNLIGDIINLSQELNTLIWNNIANGATIEDVQPIYHDVCKLSIASGIAIDMAKKEFSINLNDELQKLRIKYKQTKDGKSVKPKFFAHIAKQKGYYNPSSKIYDKHETAMDYLQYCVNSFRCNKKGKSKKMEFVSFSDVIDKSGFNYQNVMDKQIVKILNEVDELNIQLSAIYSDNNLPLSDKHRFANDLRQNFIEYIGEMKFNRDTMIALLQTIEKDENKKYKRLLFYTLFGYPNTSFYSVIKNSKNPIPKLIENNNGNMKIFGQKFTKIC